MPARIAVVIATKNRSQEIERYALASLERSECRDFVCVVWDASDDDKTQGIAEGRTWGFPLAYFRAPRAGSSSQRNDAVEHVLEHHPTVRYILFIDDDSEVSVDAIGGLLTSFQSENVWGVNIPHVSELDGEGRYASPFPETGARVMTSYLHNRSVCPESRGVPVDWLSGCSMAFRREIFEDLRLRFPEAFQRFGGYALGEDVALSFYLKKKLGKELINACSGALCHHAAGGARLNVAGMAASKWYNFHLLFDTIYDDVHGARRLWLKIKFKLFMCAAALKVLLRARSRDLASVLRGVREAQKALKEYHRENDIHTLFRKAAAQGDGKR